MTGRELDRRWLLTAGGAALLSACIGDAPRPSPTATSQSPSPPAPSASPSPRPTATLPSTRPWTPAAQEVEPRAKLAATRVVEAIGNVERSAATDPGSSARRLEAAGGDPELSAQVGDLAPPDEPAVTTVVYPQYGGLTDDKASVMVVTEQIWVEGPATEPARRMVTADVRLSRRGAGWVVTDLLPVEHEQAAAGEGRVAELLATSRVDLPDAAAVDLADGVVDPMVTGILLDLAETYTMRVSVFRSGHPDNVFGTSSTSNHTRGRAVDIWAIDDRPVVEMALDDALLVDFLVAARELGSDEVGGPSVPPGQPAGVFFANALHRDHVHVGFDP